MIYCLYKISSSTVVDKSQYILREKSNYQRKRELNVVNSTLFLLFYFSNQILLIYLPPLLGPLLLDGDDDG